MTSELLAALKDLEGYVVTHVEATRAKTQIGLSGPAGSVSLVLVGCDWNDERCETCRCAKDRVRVEIR